MKYILLSFLFIFNSCGLKITENVDDNVLLGTWSLNAISCYSSKESTIEIERYSIPNSLNITLTFSGNKATYAASGVCTTSSVGLYSTNFNGTSTGILDIIDVLTGGETCEEDLEDSGVSSVGTHSISTTLDGTYSTNLEWLVTNERDILELTYFTGFRGSANETACGATCYCKAQFRSN